MTTVTVSDDCVTRLDGQNRTFFNHQGRLTATVRRIRSGDRTVKFEIRRAFKKFGLEPTGELFDRAYAYVAEHY